jgi:cyclin B
MRQQIEINQKMRAILLDWLVDVHLRFNLRDETLFLSQFIIDSYIVNNQVQRNQLQLLGITAMLIASKYEEIYPPQVPLHLLFCYFQIKDFIHVTDNAYNNDDVLRMEGQILISLKFDLSQVSSLIFLRKFAQEFRLD